MRGRSLVTVEREAVLEVQVEDEREREREDENRHRERAAFVGFPVSQRANAAHDEEQHGEQSLRQLRPVVTELPTEVLHVIAELVSVERERMPRVAESWRLRRIVEDRRLAVLLARQHRPQRLPIGRLTFVDRRMEAGADREIDVHRQPDDRDQQCGERERHVARDQRRVDE